MYDPVKSVLDTLDEFTFTGVLGTCNPVFSAAPAPDRVNMVAVSCVITVPDRNTNEPTRLQINRLYWVPPNKCGEIIAEETIQWLKKFWEHEFYEGLIRRGKRVRDLHGSRGVPYGNG